MDKYDENRSEYQKLLSFCDIAMKSQKNRIVSYMNCWWKQRDFDYEKTELDKVMKYKKEGDSDEFLMSF